MPEATNHRHILQFVIGFVAVRMKVTAPAAEKIGGAMMLAVRLVVVEHDGVLCVAGRAVEPHFALALRRFARLPQYLDVRFVGVKQATPLPRITGAGTADFSIGIASSEVFSQLRQL